MSETIKVVVRVRPINSKESDMGCQSITKVDTPNNQLIIVKPNEAENVKTFAYDAVFDADSLQSVVYAKTAFSLVQNVLQGYNGTIFAYGQTGCGKTHSMVGKLDNEELQGIIPRSFGHILNTISQTKNREYLIRCSFIEIYNQEVRDLLGNDVKKSLQIKQSPDKGVFIKDLSSNSAKTHEQLMGYMNLGNRMRSVGETAMNKDSSRSHLLFMLYLESADLSVPEENRKYIASKLNLVDLAGSERINKTGAQGQRLQQAKNINLSLSALGNVISALVDGKSHHIPYRDSKLTRLLQDSLGGNTKTVMIANCSPADYNFQETLSTLRYASRAKFIKNKPIINEDPKDALLKEYSQQIKKLKEILSNQGGVGEYIESEGEKNMFSEKIKEKQQQLNHQKQQKRILQQKLKALQSQHFVGQNVKIDKKIQQKIRQVRQSIIDPLPISMTDDITNSSRLQFSPLTSFSAEKNISIESNSDKCKQTVKLYKAQIKSLQNELKDIEHENYLDKEEILNDIRDLSKQNKLLQGIVRMLLSPKQLFLVKNKVSQLQSEQTKNPNLKTFYGFDQNKNQYKVPHFWLKIKDIILPKISDEDHEINASEKNRFVAKSAHHNQNSSQYFGSNGSILGKQAKQNRATNIIMQARQMRQIEEPKTSPALKKVRPAQLEPLTIPQINNRSIVASTKNHKNQKPRKLQKLPLNYQKT